jgi:multidrug efflux system membrane fusion protein
MNEAQAVVGEAKARFASSQDDLEVSMLDIEYCRVTLPIDGIVGRSQIMGGNLVILDQTLLTTVVSRDPLYAYFDLDEMAFLDLRQPIQEGKVKAKTLADLPVAVGLANEDDFPHKGTLNFVDNHVDPKTGTVRLRVVLPDRDGRVVPGPFVRVRLTTSEPYKALLVSERAFEKMSGDEESKFVFGVNDKYVVERRRVVGSRQDRFVVV